MMFSRKTIAYFKSRVVYTVQDSIIPISEVNSKQSSNSLKSSKSVTHNNASMRRKGVREKSTIYVHSIKLSTISRTTETTTLKILGTKAHSNVYTGENELSNWIYVRNQ